MRPVRRKRFYSSPTIRTTSQCRRKKQNESGKNMNSYVTPDQPNQIARITGKRTRKRHPLPQLETRDWMTPNETALALGCSVAMVHRLRRGVLGLPNSPGPALDKGNKQQNALSVGKEHAIKPEGPAEILVIVAEFSGRGDFDPTARIYGSLADHVHEVIPKLGRVERVAESVVSRKDAVALASQYKASMIVWGFYDSLGVSPRYDVTRDSLVMKSALIQLDQATRHALGERFEPYVTHDLTEEISYLSLVAIGEMCMLNLSYDAGISVFERALSLIQDPERAAKLGAGKAYAGLSALLATTHRNKEALAAIAQARQLDPSNSLYQLQELTFQVGEGVTPMAEAFN